ncbi:amino acid ABC transporter permease [Deinococcus aquaticus]|uniref:Amino acid ABC transporter permease n=1 Tax=Deinococcus aquaticus TaxID=328692 RepID=A0ABY7V904_9DEIO|nr:amino acid ABC transporter permease [Deinococcus aquaticus]WDA60817.1 amino acid ABC transporter permease [Deinococcus aquaticus]
MNAAGLSFLVPGLGHLLTRQTSGGVKSALLATLTWTLVVRTLPGGFSVPLLLCLAAALVVHAGAGLSARSGAHRGESAAATRRARADQRRWSTLSSAAVVLALLGLTVQWALSLPGWSEISRNLPFFLMGKLRSGEYDPLRWRLSGLLLPALGLLLAWALSRVRHMPVWPPALSVALGLVSGSAVLWPLLVPETVLGGFALSVVLTFLALTLAVPLGLLAGIMRVSTLPVIRLIATVYIDLFRAVPLIVWVFGAFLLLPYMLGTGTQFPSVVLALATFTGAYFAEIVRAGIQSLPQGQSEAARSLGLTGTQTMLRVVLPQALRRMVPPLLGQTITLFKDTSLVSIVGMAELAGTGRITANRLVSATFEIYLAISLLYFLVASALSVVADRLERAPGVPGRRRTL